MSATSSSVEFPKGAVRRNTTGCGLRLRRLLIGIGALPLLGACTDSPLAPLDEADLVASTSLEPTVEGDPCAGTCILEPIGIEVPPSDGSTCNPWDWDISCDDGPGTGQNGPGDREGEDDGGGGGLGPGEDDVPADTCRTGDPIVDSKNVFAGFEDLWTQSVAAGEERGGWIVNQGGSFSLVPFQNATYHECGIDLYESPPTGTVAMVHTHPWPLFAYNGCGFLNTGTPSGEDRDALELLGLSTGYILDANGISKYTAGAGETGIRLERCAY